MKIAHFSVLSRAPPLGNPCSCTNGCGKINFEGAGAMTETINEQDFGQIDIRVGTIVQAEPFPEARTPAFRLAIDFGPELGMRRSVARITVHYRPDQLIGRQVCAVVNLPSRQIGPHVSEVLTLGLPDDDGGVVLIRPDFKVPDGGRLF
jgi:tRNA-binding protein